MVDCVSLPSRWYALVSITTIDKESYNKLHAAQQANGEHSERRSVETVRKGRDEATP